MKTLKTMILTAGVAALLGANYAQASSAAPTGGAFTTSAISGSHDAMPIGNVATGAHDVQTPASLPGDANREKPPVLVAPTCSECIQFAPAALSNWQKLRLALSVVLG
jgi:hypothetical protein